MIVLVPTRLEMRRLFPELGDAPLDRAPREWLAASPSRPAVSVAWCGFGLASAGAGAAAILAKSAEVPCLVGFSGTLDRDACAVGSVVVATSVDAHGIGLPASDEASSSREGSPVSNPGALDAELAADPSFAEPPPPVMTDALRDALGPGDRAGAILSVAMPAHSVWEASKRAAAHPDCLVEEMEALAVLHAAAACGRRLTIVRGVTNEAGYRDKSDWRVDDAVASLRGVLERWLR